MLNFLGDAPLWRPRREYYVEHIRRCILIVWQSQQERQSSATKLHRSFYKPSDIGASSLTGLFRPAQRSRQQQWCHLKPLSKPLQRRRENTLLARIINATTYAHLRELWLHRINSFEEWDQHDQKNQPKDPNYQYSPAHEMEKSWGTAEAKSDGIRSTSSLNLILPVPTNHPDYRVRWSRGT